MLSLSVEITTRSPGVISMSISVPLLPDTVIGNDPRARQRTEQFTACAPDSLALFVYGVVT